MDTPTASDLRARSELLTAKYPAPTPPAEESPAFVALIEDTSALVAGWTGRLIAPVDEGVEVPAGLVGVAKRAIARLVERVDVASSASSASASATGRLLRSISAGPWAEAYFAPGDLVLKNGVVAITGDPLLDGWLWALMTDEMREQWLALATGKQAPAGAVTEFDYRRQNPGYGGRGQRVGIGPDGY